MNFECNVMKTLRWSKRRAINQCLQLYVLQASKAVCNSTFSCLNYGVHHNQQHLLRSSLYGVWALHGVLSKHCSF